MLGDRGRGQRKYLLGTCLGLLISIGLCRADDNGTELRTLVEQQGKQIEELKRQLKAVSENSAGKENAARSASSEPAAAGDQAKPGLDDAAVKNIVADYLKENPGAGMPPSVQTGYSPAGGFFVRSAPDPKYIKWDDQSRIPFELRIRGRMQLDYYGYKVTDRTNHLINRPAVQNANAVRQADFSQLEVKAARLIFEGTAFDPNLRYHLQLDGNTRGIGGFQNNKVVQTAGAFDPNAAATSPVGGGVLVDHTVRIFDAWVAYDFHPCASEAGCGPDCPPGTVRYSPTLTVIVGKQQPFFSFEEIMGRFNQQMVEYGMTEFFFDSDDNNQVTGAGTQIKALEDRLFVQALITNGNDSQFPNAQMDNLPGFQAGFWYDFGGSWNAERQRWDLYGDSIADIDYSCRPVVRVGGATNIVPMGRRSLYGDLEQTRVFVVPGGPQGGSRLINILNGDALAPNGSHAVDEFDSYTYEAFIAGKYRGFSIMNDWFFRNLNNFRTTPNGLGNIIYQDAAGANALFPANHGLFDYGTQVMAGYFVVPKKVEVVGRWGWIRGDSGDINGNGRFRTVSIPGVATPVRVVDGAFQNFHEAREYGIGVNYYFKRQLLKWQTDFSVYDGGNPAGGGQSLAGFIPGSDGWLIRSQIQLAF
jgi:hypothetical protein